MFGVTYPTVRRAHSQTKYDMSLYSVLTPPVPASVVSAQMLCLGLLAFYPDERWTIQDAFHSQWIQSDLGELAAVYLQRVGNEAAS